MTKYREIENPTARKVQVGDRVTFTLPRNPEYGEITATAIPSEWTEYLLLVGYATDHVDVLKIERPVPTLPEEDGLYTIACDKDTVAYARVFRLWGGVWTEMNPGPYTPFTGSLKDQVESGEWTLTCLVMEDSNAQ